MHIGTSNADFAVPCGCPGATAASMQQAARKIPLSKGNLYGRQKADPPQFPRKLISSMRSTSPRNIYSKGRDPPKSRHPDINLAPSRCAEI